MVTCAFKASSNKQVAIIQREPNKSEASLNVIAFKNSPFVYFRWSVSLAFVYINYRDKTQKNWEKNPLFRWHKWSIVDLCHSAICAKFDKQNQQLIFIKQSIRLSFNKKNGTKRQPSVAPSTFKFKQTRDSQQKHKRWIFHFSMAFLMRNNGFLCNRTPNNRSILSSNVNKFARCVCFLIFLDSNVILFDMHHSIVYVDFVQPFRHFDCKSPTVVKNDIITEHAYLHINTSTEWCVLPWTRILSDYTNRKWACTFVWIVM